MNRGKNRREKRKKRIVEPLARDGCRKNTVGEERQVGMKKSPKQARDGRKQGQKPGKEPKKKNTYKRSPMDQNKVPCKGTERVERRVYSLRDSRG